MSTGDSWVWTTLVLLGAYHGINPGMGWLFAVALGLQERRGSAVGRALVPIAIGHGLSIAAVVAAAAAVGTLVPLPVLRVVVASILFVFGLYYLIRQRHPRWGGMQVGFRDLTFWSFLMATAHGAGLMVLPILFGLSQAHAGGIHAGGDGVHSLELGSGWTGLWAVLVHTTGYLLVTGLVAWVVYQKVGVAFLRRAWFNLDLVWALALLITAAFTLLA